MAKAQRMIQQLDHWFAHSVGKRLIDAEYKKLHSLLKEVYSHHALLIGVPHQQVLLQASRIAYPVLLSSLVSKHSHLTHIESDFCELPVASASMNLVILPHILEFIRDPQQLLSEACRVVAPEGHIIILGFNPFGFWGLRKLFTKHSHVPWTGHFCKPGLIRTRLLDAGFDMLKQETFSYRPPTTHAHFHHKLAFLEQLGDKFSLPWGGIYVLMAQAKVAALTPLKPAWTTALNEDVLPSGIPNPTTRNPK